ncbi:DUF4192 family protein [Streptomyces decoyicus]|uniref:DUF4192 family protein n=1 Tax=Streptomyces decoyicus TaxID=249567 RepID=UPI0039999230
MRRRQHHHLGPRPPGPDRLCQLLASEDGGAYLVRHCAAPYTEAAVPALTLFAFVAWRQQDLISARLALRQALITDPDYELATGIHLATIDREDPRELLAVARQARAERLAGL